MNFATAQAPHIEIKIENRNRDPFVMPDGNGEKTNDYVITVKRESPIEYKACAGLVFQKRTFSPDWSYRENEGTFPDTYIPTVSLTDKQYKAVKKRLEETETVIPRVIDGKTGKEKNGIYRDKLSNHLIIEKLENYRVNKVYPETVGQQSFQEELIQEQMKSEKRK